MSVSDVGSSMVKSESRPVPASPPAPVTQYAQGFPGAATDAFAADAAKILTAAVAVNEVELRDDGIIYMPGVWYRRILIRAFGPGAWALLPRGPARTMGEIIVYHGALYILGRFVSESMGECETRFGMSYASALEGARTDCLTRCCKDLGMAAELWDPEWRDSWLKKNASRVWMEPVGQQKKGRWKYTRLEVPLTGVITPGRNSGGSASAPTPPTETATAHQAPVPQLVLEPDEQSGEAPSAEELKLLRGLVKELKWAKPHAVNWLKAHFGANSSDELTREQCEAGVELLRAAMVDDMDETYGAVLAKLEKEGRVLPPKISQ